MAACSIRKERKPAAEKAPRSLYIIFFILSVLVLTGGYCFLRHQSATFRKGMEDDLTSISQVKAQAIANWRRERAKDAEIITASPFFTEKALLFIRNPSDQKLRKEILSWFASRLDPENYRSISLVDSKLNVLLSYPEPSEPLGPDTIHILENSLSRGEPVVSDLLYQYTVQGIHMDMAAPILDQHGRARGAVIIRVDPYITLYPLIQTWPTESETAETLLLREDNGEALYLNELRHRRGTALNLRSGPASDDELAKSAVSGYQGIFRGKDYRGKKVLAYVEEIPGTDWKMAAKVDLSELEAPLTFRTYIVTFLLFLLLLFFAMLLAALRIRHQRELYKAKYAHQAERRALAHHFEYLTKYANDIILLMDEKERIVEANEKALEVYGYSRDEFLGMSLRQLRAGEGPPEFGEKLLDKASDGLIYETIHRRKDGGIFPVEVSARTIRVDDHLYFQAIIRDITERKRFQEKLEKINECFLSMGEDAMANMAKITATAGELLSSREAHYTRFDDGQVFIYSTLRPQRFEKLDPEILTSWRMLAESASAAPNKVAELSGMLRAIPDTGLAAGYPVSYFAAATKHGRELKGVLGVCFDHPRALSHDEADVLRIFARALSVEEERLAHEEELRDFVDIASHELRHPMTIIKGYADLLRVHHSEMKEEEASELLQALGEGVERMNALVQELLEAARMEKPGFSLRLEETGVSQLIEEVVKEMAAKTASVGFHVKTKDSLPSILADRERLRQILVILLDNAVKYSPPGSEVEISAEASGDEVVVGVADLGPGVPEEFRDRIFQRFFQVEDAMHHSAPGIGMGLYIARRLVEAHGGRIWYEARERGGSIFKFSIPRAKPETGNRGA